MLFAIQIWLYPTEEGLPPRALLLTGGPPVVVVYDIENEVWTVEGAPVADILNEAITEHAQSLGVEL